MLYREIIAVCSQIHTEHTRPFNVKADVTYSNLYDFKGKRVTVAATSSPVPMQPVLKESRTILCRHPPAVRCFPQLLEAKPEYLELVTTAFFHIPPNSPILTIKSFT
jgi:hypothetical protein